MMAEKSESGQFDNPGSVETTGIPNPFTELVNSFRALKGAPRGFWYTNYIYWLDGVAYFGMLTLLAMYFHDILGMSDESGHRIVSAYMALITGFMLIFGPVSDKLGVRKSLIVSVVLYIIGRSALPLVPHFLPIDSSMLLVVVFAGLLLAAAGNGFMQPASYAGVRKFSDKETATMGYGLLYAGMNLGIVFIGFMSSRIRTGIDLGENFRFDGFGIEGVMWFCVLVNALMLIILVFFFTPAVEREAEKNGDNGSGENGAGQTGPGGQAIGSPLKRFLDWLKISPLSNARFMFFIFALMPVQTLFAYQFLVMPQFVTRAFSDVVANNMEVIVNVTNPLIIVLGVPVITAMTRKVPVYKMMVIGSLVSALPTFFFLLGPNFWLLMAYLVLFSIGEALWQPRFLQYAAELAPEGQTGAYIAFANLPWFMIKFIAGWYTGRMMDIYCPAEGALNTETMWLIYGLVAMVSPVALVLAGKWVQKGLLQKCV
ncbi:MAG: MFS transporter [Xanthomonadales bacterium]|nr:MFS transporter [Gammaproteobacteria bacterium]NNK03595.1 MFS transporter [Xanthomonadales bacterium]